MHYYPHHIGDFIKDTANLNDHQMVTYLRMIWAYYAEEKPFPDDCEGIAFAMRSDEKTVHLLLRHYFELQDDGWHHTRCDRVLEDIYSKSAKARDAAQKRWAKEKNTMHNQCDGNADAMRTHKAEHADASTFNATQYPIPNTYKEEKKTTLSGKPDPAPKVDTTRQDARAVLEHLNKKVGRKFKDVDATINMISARVREYSVQECIAVIDSKVNEWRDDHKMSQYLRPKTLFAASNFASYADGADKRSTGNPYSMYPGAL